MELLIFPQKGYRLDRKNYLRKITFFINQKEREREKIPEYQLEKDICG